MFAILKPKNEDLDSKALNAQESIEVDFFMKCKDFGILIDVKHPEIKTEFAFRLHILILTSNAFRLACIVWADLQDKISENILIATKAVLKADFKVTI
jgi:hypothetical protein